MSPTEFDEFDSLLGRGQWETAFQVGWRVLHRLIRSFYINMAVSALYESSSRKPEERAAWEATTLPILDKINTTNERGLFEKLGQRFISLDVSTVIKSRSPSLWLEYEQATQPRHFIFHGKVYSDRELDVRASAETLRRLIEMLDMLFKDTHDIWKCVRDDLWRQ